MSEPTSGTPTPGPQAPPEGRYGEPGRGSAFTSKSVAVVLTLLVGAFLAAGGYTIYQLNVTPSVTTEVVGVEVIDDERVDLSLAVTRDAPETPVYCIVRAQEESKGELGRREIYVPPSESSTIVVDTFVTTSQRAFMADAYGCGEDIPDYLRR